MSATLTIAGLDAGYSRLSVIRKVDMVVQQGQTTVLLGPNGAGKTTLLRAICGMAKVQGGQVRVGDQDITGASTNKVVAAGLGFVPAGRQIFREQSVESNLDLGMFGTGLRRAARNARIDTAYELFPILAEFRQRTAGLLSGGQQQMLAVAQVLVREPSVLLLDEPSLGLAPVVVHELFGAIGELRNAGMTVVVVEQAVELALALSDHAYVLAGGQIVLSGAPDAVRHDPALAAAFLGKGRSTPERTPTT
jgi:branched-chain amino acid transport system ATP-binding protein